jgi:hypothetical protein
LRIVPGIHSAATTASATPATFEAAATAAAAFATLTAAAISGCIGRAEAFNSVLNLFESRLDDRFHGLFLVAGKADFRLCKEFFDRVHRVGLFATRSDVAATEQRRREAAASPFFLS